MTLKNNIFFALLAAACTFTSCNSENEPEAGYGELQLTLDSEEEIISVQSKAQPSEQQLASYLLTVTQGGEVVMNQERYSTKVVNGKMGMKAGEGYVLTAESCTETDAETAEEGWGKARFSGSSEPFDIELRKLTSVSVLCTMQNAKVTVSYDRSFSSTFTDYNVEVYETSAPGRTLSFSPMSNILTACAYFNIDADPQLTYVIKGRINGGEKKTLYQGTVELASAKWCKLVCRATPSGKAEMNVVIDNTVEDKDENIDINPYN